MKWIKRFNESLTQKELKEVKYDIEDVLVDLDDLNNHNKDEILYKIHTFSNSSSMRDVSISEVFKINVRFWKNFDLDGSIIQTKLSPGDLEQLKPIFDRLVRVMEPHSNTVDLVFEYIDKKGETQFKEVSYKPEYLNKAFSIKNIVELKLKFELK